MISTTSSITTNIIQYPNAKICIRDKGTEDLGPHRNGNYTAIYETFLNKYYKLYHDAFYIIVYEYFGSPRTHVTYKFDLKCSYLPILIKGSDFENCNQLKSWDCKNYYHNIKYIIRITPKSPEAKNLIETVYLQDFQPYFKNSYNTEDELFRQPNLDRPTLAEYIGVLEERAYFKDSSKEWLPIHWFKYIFALSSAPTELKAERNNIICTLKPFDAYIKTIIDKDRLYTEMETRDNDTDESKCILRLLNLLGKLSNRFYIIDSTQLILYVGGYLDNIATIKTLEYYIRNPIKFIYKVKDFIGHIIKGDKFKETVNEFDDDHEIIKRKFIYYADDKCLQTSHLEHVDKSIWFLFDRMINECLLRRDIEQILMELI